MHCRNETEHEESWRLLVWLHDQSPNKGRVQKPRFLCKNKMQNKIIQESPPADWEYLQSCSWTQCFSSRTPPSPWLGSPCWSATPPSPSASFALQALQGWKASQSQGWLPGVNEVLLKTRLHCYPQVWPTLSFSSRSFLGWMLRSSADDFGKTYCWCQWSALLNCWLDWWGVSNWQSNSETNLFVHSVHHNTKRKL